MLADAKIVRRPVVVASDVVRRRCYMCVGRVESCLCFVEGWSRGEVLTCHGIVDQAATKTSFCICLLERNTK